jgi:hypothetical protein
MFHRKVWRSDTPHRSRTALRVEELESRVVPYAVTGNAWPHPQLVTISFVPDGTLIGYNQNGPIYSTLFADFNAQFPTTAAWQKQILLAAQSWAAATNLNFAVVSDDGVDIGTIDGDFEQGDPLIGDIRVAGFQDTGAGYLAQAYLPPPANNYSVAGDLWFNTSQGFHIGSDYDLYTVAAHEIGHALGMDHSGNPSAIMAPIYPGHLTGLTSDDAAGIESIYSGGAARSHDVYNQGSTHNSSFATAAAFTVAPAPVLTAQLANLDINTVGMNEYFKFVAPALSLGTLHLSIQSKGLSLLSPRVWVYNSSQVQIGYLSGANTYGATLNLNVNGIVAGRTYYIKVNGSENDALGTGLYDLSLSLGLLPTPPVTPPDTLTDNGDPINEGGSMPEADGDAYDAPPAGTISAPAATSAFTPFGLGMFEVHAPAFVGVDERALHVLDHRTTDPHVKALAQHVLKMAASEDAHDPAQADVLESGSVPVVRARQ